MASDKISANDIFETLNDKYRKTIKMDVRQFVGSTNDELKSLALKGEKEGYLLIAEMQTQGRGRLGRSFFSPDSTGIYMSLLLRPAIRPESVTLVTSAAAVAVCSALEKISENSLKPQIKWVNDIYLNGKKICGILTEGGFINNDKIDYAVVGLGINFYEPKNGFPEELSEIAGSVFEKENEGIKNRFIGEFLNSFLGYYYNLEKREFIEEYRKRCFVIGKGINIIKGDTITSAEVLGVDDNCGLHVRFDDGNSSVVYTGEISVRII